ncbi:hypothetical protein [Pseudoduganella sp. RAF53_2]|uniref:hypothetical protein n=1 Tax=unclassified Pseudoduganella TaxID=2637179 RepID=UPI003F949ADB
MVIHRGGSYNSGAIGASPTYRGHTSTDNRNSVAERFRIAEDLTDNTDKTTGTTAFERELTSAQAAELGKHAKPQR